MASVKVKVDADGTGFHRVMGGVENRIRNMGSGMKAALAGAFSAASIGAISNSVLKFGDEIQTMANNFDISTDMAQQFARAAKNANIEVNLLGKAMLKLDEAMSDAMSGDKSKLSILSRLGFSEKDISTLRPENALLKMLQVNKDKPMAQLRPLLAGLGMKPSEGGKLMGAANDILSNPLGLVPENTIAKLDALGDAMSDLGTVILTTIIPVFLRAATAVVGFISSMLGNIRIESAANRAAEKVAQQTGGVNKGEAFFANAIAPYNEKYFNSRQYRETIYGKAGADEYFKVRDALQNADADNKTTLGKIEIILNDLKKKLTSDDLTLNKKIPFLRIASDTTKKEVKNTISAIGDLGGNEFMKIGGALGIDMRYRMERIAVEANALMKRTANAVESINNKMSVTAKQQEFPE